MAKVKSERDLVDNGIRALVEALGYSGAARFLGMRLEQIYKKAAEHYASKQS